MFFCYLWPPQRARLFFVWLFQEAHKAVGRALEWGVLGVAEDETAMVQYRE